MTVSVYVDIHVKHLKQNFFDMKVKSYNVTITAADMQKQIHGELLKRKIIQGAALVDTLIKVTNNGADILGSVGVKDDAEIRKANIQYVLKDAVPTVHDFTTKLIVNKIQKSGNEGKEADIFFDPSTYDEYKDQLLFNAKIVTQNNHIDWSNIKFKSVDIHDIDHGAFRSVNSTRPFQSTTKFHQQMIDMHPAGITDLYVYNIYKIEIDCDIVEKAQQVRRNQVEKKQEEDQAPDGLIVPGNEVEMTKDEQKKYKQSDQMNSVKLLLPLGLVAVVVVSYVVYVNMSGHGQKPAPTGQKK